MNSHARFQFGHCHVIAENRNRVRTAQLRGMHADPVSFQIHMTESAVFPIGHQQARLTETRVNRQIVAGLEFAVLFTFSAEALDDFPRRIRVVMIRAGCLTVALVAESRHSGE